LCAYYAKLPLHVTGSKSTCKYYANPLMWQDSILTCIYYATAVSWWVSFFVFSFHHKYQTKMTCGDSLLIFIYVHYFVYIYRKMLKLMAEDIRLIPQQIQNIVQKMRYYIKKFITYVLYVYIHFHLAAFVTGQQEKLGTNLCDNLLIQIDHSIARMLNSVFIIIISEAKSLGLFILTNHMVS
jgi:hypothetical protein